MTNQLDDLFSPERLRRNWQPAEKSAGRDKAQDEEKDRGPRELFERLQGLILGRFSEDDAEVLGLQLEHLRALLGRRFPDAEKAEPAPKEQAELNSAIDEVLNRIEDLAEAFELAGRSH